MNRYYLILMVVLCILSPTAGAAAVAQVSVSVSPDTIQAGGTGQVLVTVMHERFSYTSDTRDSPRAQPLPGATVTLSTTAAGITFSPSSGKTDSQGRFTSTLYASPAASGSIAAHAVAEIPGDYRGEGTGTVTILEVTTRTTVPPQETNRPPVADLSVDTYAGTAPLAVRFDGMQSHDPDGAVASYAWDFGDGEGDEGYVVTHTYQGEGTYTASLVVTDNLGLSSGYARQVIVVSAGTNPDSGGKTDIGEHQVQTAVPEKAGIARPFRILQMSAAGHSDKELDLNHDNRLTSDDTRLALNDLLTSRKKTRSCVYTPAAAANYTKEEWDRKCLWEPEPVLKNWTLQFKKSNLDSQITAGLAKITKADLGALQKKYSAGSSHPVPSFLSEFSTLNGMNRVWSEMAAQNLASSLAQGKTSPVITRVRDASDLPKDTLPSTYPVKEIALPKSGTGSVRENQPSASVGMLKPTKKTDEEYRQNDPSRATLRKMGLDYWQVPAEFQENYIIEGSYAIIEGRDLGICPQSGPLEKGDNIVCNVTLKWQKSNEFFSTDSEAINDNIGSIDLLPATGDWKTSWNSYGIGVWIPHSVELPRSGKMTIDIERKKVTCKYTGECTNCPAYVPDNIAKGLYCTGEPEILTSGSHDVFLVKDMPGFSGIYSDPMYTGEDVVNGGDLLITGTNFGDTPGKVEVVLDQPFEAYALAEPYQKLSPPSLMPPDGRQVPVIVTQWSNSSIRLKIQNIRANFGNQDGKILVTKNGTPTPSFTSVTFGPRWEMHQISGEKFFSPSPERQEGLIHERVNNMYVVQHDPRCADWDIISGTEGDDRFFSGKPLPPNLKVKRIFFMHAQPGYDEVEYILEWVNREYGLLTFDPVTWIKFLADAIAKLADDKCGSYLAKIWNWESWWDSGTLYHKVAPVDFEKDPSQIYVHWENTCWEISPFEDKNVAYTISFIVEYPEGVDAGA